MKFTNIKAVFKVAEDTAFKEGRWKKDRSDFVFVVRRYVSGCSAYGDRSGHSIEIDNHPEFMGNYYDTRYDRIPVDKTEWVNFWRNKIEEDYGMVIKLTDYETKVEEIED